MKYIRWMAAFLIALLTVSHQVIKAAIHLRME